MSKDPHNFEKRSKGEGKSKKIDTMKKEEEKPTCSHCEKRGHDEDHCWNFHPKLRPKWA